VLCFKLNQGAVGMWVGLCVALIVIGSSLAVVWRRAMHGSVQHSVNVELDVSG